MIDQFENEIKTNEPIIVNTDTDDNNGVHWIVIVERPTQKLYIYDPLGKKNKRVNSQGQSVNTFLSGGRFYPYESQLKTTTNCGYFAIYVAKLLKEYLDENPNATNGELDNIIINKFGTSADFGDAKLVKKNLKISSDENSNEAENESSDDDDVFTDIEGGLNFKGLFSNRVGFKPSMRTLLENIGDIPIKSIQIARTPLRKEINFIIKSLKKKSYKGTPLHDKLFHLFAIITLDRDNGSFILEKNQDINLVKLPKKPIKYIQIYQGTIYFNEGLTINKMLNETLDKVGAYTLYDYDAIERNCQKFIMDLLESNDIKINQALKSFIKQDVNNLIPSWGQKLAYWVTSAKNRIDQFLDGSGETF